MKRKNVFQKGAAIVAFLLVSTLSLTSCNKDDDNGSDIQESEAVDAVSNSLSEDTNGMAKSMDTTLDYAEDQNLYTVAPNLNCGQLYTVSYAENYSSTNYTYNYSATCNYQLNCNSDGAAQSFNYEANRAGDYDTPRMSSDDNAVAQWTITNLETANVNTLFNGSYVRTGTQVSKIRNQNTFSSTLTYSLSNIAVSKATHRIASGSATVTFTGVSSTGNQYTYNGTITFNGDNTATLVINGNTYTINL
jgi:predicted small secreted protein